jgi:uncharacterized repeat protein (TIGR01451 family)
VPNPVEPGGGLTFTLTLNNTDPITATGVVVTDTLPVSTTFQTDLSGACTKVGSSPDLLRCQFASLPGGGGSQSFAFTATAPSAPGVITNTAVFTNTAGVTVLNSPSTLSITVKQKFTLLLPAVFK